MKALNRSSLCQCWKHDLNKKKKKETKEEERKEGRKKEKKERGKKASKEGRNEENSLPDVLTTWCITS
jgi:hypothetical protein